MGDGGQKIVLHRFRNENALQETRQLKITLQEEIGEGRKMFQNLVFPKTILPPYLTVLGYRNANSVMKQKPQRVQLTTFLIHTSTIYGCTVYVTRNPSSLQILQ